MRISRRLLGGVLLFPAACLAHGEAVIGAALAFVVCVVCAVFVALLIPGKGYAKLYGAIATMASFATLWILSALVFDSSSISFLLDFAVAVAAIGIGWLTAHKAKALD